MSRIPNHPILSFSLPFFITPLLSFKVLIFLQTWEDPNSMHPETKAKGDNDPIDVCEIGEEVGYPGQIKQVKILGTMALLDEGETDWKLIAIDVNDPLAPKLNDIEDVERHLPGLLRASNEFWRIYKVLNTLSSVVFFSLFTRRRSR